ncbi:MAG: hypothetical protein M3069_07665, partial [Chloroflexota bacterium]|nr:hypothetical protein [Chloroflexota bacterium]
MQDHLNDVDEHELERPPHSVQAEEAVLGSVLKRGLAIADVAPFLTPQHFYDAHHRYIYAAMAALFDRAAAIDYHTIAEELQHQGTYEHVGGRVYLSELSLSTSSSAHIEHYARIVLEHAVRRRYISAGQQMADSPGIGVRTWTPSNSAQRRWCWVPQATPSRRAVLTPSEWTAHLVDDLGQARTGGL